MILGPNQAMGPVSFTVPPGARPVAVVVEEFEPVESELLFTLPDVLLP